MPTTTSKRKRAKHACIPCHQRKRKCDAEYPCNMCTAYDYNCRYKDSTAGNIARTNITLDLHGEGGISRKSTPRPRQVSEVERSSTHAVAVSSLNTTTAGPTGTSAAMAFPHILGVALGSERPPKVHSFAYNFGIRPDDAEAARSVLLGQLISEGDLRLYSDTFFSAMGLFVDFIDARIYAQRCHEYYHTSSSSIAFEAVAAGIAALGSFLSLIRHPREAELVQYGKAILDDPASTQRLDVDHIVAWAMRVLYLRATTRPNNAWIASCTAMHLCEAVGLHEEENIVKMASASGAAALGHDADRLRRIFWIGWAGHTILSYECDRSSVHFRDVTCSAIIPINGSVAHDFVHMAQIIPGPNSPFHLQCQPATPREELLERLRELDKLQIADPFLVVTKADLTFCLFRRIYLLKEGISDETVRLVIDNGDPALKASEQLASQGRLFWNIIGSVFQYACILLAVDTPTTLERLAAAFKCLEYLVETADTNRTREALSTARHLLTLHKERKRKDLLMLEAIETTYRSSATQRIDAEAVVTDMSWDLDWDQFFLEPHLSLFDGDQL